MADGRVLAAYANVVIVRTGRGPRIAHDTLTAPLKDGRDTFPADQPTFPAVKAADAAAELERRQTSPYRDPDVIGHAIAIVDLDPAIVPTFGRARAHVAPIQQLVIHPDTPDSDNIAATLATVYPFPIQISNF